MATAATGWKCTHTATKIAETDTTYTIRVTGYWANNGWTYDINFVSAWVYCIIDGVKNKQQVKDNSTIKATSSNYQSVSIGYYDFVVPKGTSTKSISCYAKITSESSYVSGSKYSTSTSMTVPAKTSYAVTYNANGGTGAPGKQTKWYGTNLTLASTKPTRTGHTFVKWNTAQNGSGTTYNPGATYSANTALTLYAIWSANTYQVSYNANGGINPPSNQTKTYGVNLTLSSVIPTRENYDFLGWSTSSDGGALYQPGGSYTNNNAVTLYAVWKLAYIKPRINNFLAQRCASDGAIIEDGEYVKVTFGWETDLTTNGIVIEWKSQLDETWTNATVTASGTSGSINQIVGEGKIDIEKSYIFRAYVSDANDRTYSPQILISTLLLPIDVKRGGVGVSIGKVAEEEGIFDVAYTTKLRGGLTPIFLEAEADLNDIRTPNFYTGENITTNNYSNCPLTSGTFYLEVVSCGDEGQVRQTITSCSKTDAVTYQRFYYEKSWGEWFYIDSLSAPVIPGGTNLDDIKKVGLYSGGSQTAAKYVNVPPLLTEGTFSLEVTTAGNSEQRRQLLVTTHKTESQIYERFYYEDSWGSWIDYSTKFKDIITVIGNSAITLTTTNVTPMSMKGSVVIGTKLTNNTSGHVIIGAGVKYVKIEGSAYAYSGFTNGDLAHVNITKNDSVVYQAIKRISGTYETIAGAAKIISVAEGDVLKLCVRNQSGARGTFNYNGNCTYMTVEVVA